jgi:hypothetical protein
MLSLIAEFLEFYQMDYSLSVYLPEANITNKDFDRNTLAKSSGLSKPDPERPILQQMISDFLKGNVSKGAAFPAGNNDDKKSKEPEKEKEKIKPTVITGPMKVGPGGTSANSATAGKNSATPVTNNSKDSASNAKVFLFIN